MQDTELMTSSPADMSPYQEASKYNSPASSPSPSLPEPSSLRQNHPQYLSDDEISVGCPSPKVSRYQIATASPCRSEDCGCGGTEPPEQEEYFKPLKKLKMVRLESIEAADRNEGVKSFSIADILSHKPAKTSPQPARIVRPWDLDPELEAQQSLERFHRHLKAQQLALLRPEFAFAAAASYASETGSDRSSSVTSDCCSPDIITAASVHHQHQHQQRQKHQQGKQPGATPLDALFQMTSKTFDSSTGESSAGRRHGHLTLM